MGEQATDEAILSELTTLAHFRGSSFEPSHDPTNSHYTFRLEWAICAPPRSMTSRTRARRNMRCSPCCWRALRSGAARASGALRGDPSPLGVAHAALAEAASRASVEGVEREYFNLFIGLGRGELLPYGSYYLTGFLHERPLARLRDDWCSSASSAPPGQAEPEDHAAILCEIMAGLASRRFAVAGRTPIGQLSSSISRRGSDVSLPISSAPKPPTFIARMERLGRVFMEIETRASRCRLDAKRDEQSKKRRASHHEEATAEERAKQCWRGASFFARSAPERAGSGSRGRSRAMRTPTPKTMTRRRKARYKAKRGREDLLSRQPLSELRRDVMLIRRTERPARRGALADTLQAHRKAVLTAARSCAARGSQPAGSPRSARCRWPACARHRPAAAARRRASHHPQEHLHPLLGRLHGRSPKSRTASGSARSPAGTPDQPRLALRQGRLGARTRAWRPAPEISDEARQRPVEQSPGTRRSTRSATS